MSTRHITIGAVLTALALIIPLQFGFLRVYIPPFSATLVSHVPSMLAMFISPLVAGAVGLGSAIGFFAVLGPVVGARAAIHMVFGVVGALLYNRGVKPWVIMLIILPIHALGEALVVLPFGWDLYSAFVITGTGTALHHIVDAAITLSIYGVLVRFLGDASELTRHSVSRAS